MSAITTHVLDLALGRPASGVAVRLERRDGANGWVTLAERTTDEDGRVRDLLDGGAALERGQYRLTFETGAYFAVFRMMTFYPEVTVLFEVRDPAQHYHVPLLVSPYGFSTYRGS